MLQAELDIVAAGSGIVVATFNEHLVPEHTTCTVLESYVSTLLVTLKRRCAAVLCRACLRLCWSSDFTVSPDGVLVIVRVNTVENARSHCEEESVVDDVDIFHAKASRSPAEVPAPHAPETNVSG
jgi:hypothetical protein